ncbi:hypothetical protein [Vaginisenegalia massiliensis]|uniref:hypothetical protein n=1 Tax=Vaginisenegalia massiliensis TaxID=2058294 RepID=UPI0019D07954|nr:hypothetical protein [Vaginisenegalia massiliensis]
MTKKMVQSVFRLNIIQILVFLFGFFNSVAKLTGNKAIVDISHISNNFHGIVFWSITSMLCVIGFTLSLFLVLSKEFHSRSNVGLIISAVGYASPIFFSQFLLIPATLLILGAIFIKALILSPDAPFQKVATPTNQGPRPMVRPQAPSNRPNQASKTPQPKPNPNSTQAVNSGQVEPTNQIPNQPME